MVDDRSPSQKRINFEIPEAVKLRLLAKRLNVSVANIFQLAWSLLLRSYTDAQDVCFCYITSGRDTEIDGIQDAVGPFINALVTRVSFQHGMTVAAILQQLFETYIDSLPHQYASLADIKHKLRLGSETTLQHQPFIP